VHLIAHIRNRASYKAAQFLKESTTYQLYVAGPKTAAAPRTSPPWPGIEQFWFAATRHRIRLNFFAFHTTRLTNKPETEG
jgi:hypothetical protein